MTPEECNSAIIAEQAFQLLRKAMPGIPVTIRGAARVLRKHPEFRGLERDPYTGGWDARFQDPEHRYYHGKAEADEDAVIIAACRWQKLELEKPKGIA